VCGLQVLITYSKRGRFSFSSGGIEFLIRLKRLSLNEKTAVRMIYGFSRKCPEGRTEAVNNAVDIYKLVMHLFIFAISFNWILDFT